MNLPKDVYLVSNIYSRETGKPIFECEITAMWVRPRQWKNMAHPDLAYLDIKNRANRGMTRTSELTPAHFPSLGESFHPELKDVHKDEKCALFGHRHKYLEKSYR